MGFFAGQLILSVNANADKPKTGVPGEEDMGQGRLLHPRFSFPSLGVLRDARVRNDTPERRQILFAFCSGHSHTRCVILPEGRLAPAGRGSRPERGHRDGVRSEATIAEHPRRGRISTNRTQVLRFAQDDIRMPF